MHLDKKRGQEPFLQAPGLGAGPNIGLELTASREG